MVVRKIFRVAFVLLLLAMPCILSAQTKKSDQLDKKISVDFTDADFITVLSELGVRQRIPIGLEQATAPPTGKLNIRVRDSRLHDILDMVVKQEPNYDWKICDGVINFSPVRDRSNVLSAFLSIRISKFSNPEANSRFRLRDAIFDLPDVKQFFVMHSLEGLKEYYPYKRSIYSVDKIEMTATDTTILAILNKIVKETEFKIWVVEISPDRTKLIISF